jgi:hypothetical protein
VQLGRLAKTQQFELGLGFAKGCALGEFVPPKPALLAMALAGLRQQLR